MQKLFLLTQLGFLLVPKIAADFVDVDGSSGDLVGLVHDSDGTVPTYPSLLAEAKALHDTLIIPTRRELHQHPELLYQEEETSKIIQRKLTELGIPFKAGWGYNTRQDRGVPGPGGTGIVVDIGTGHEPCVALRADIDALPILELPHVPFPAQNKGMQSLLDN